VKEGRKERVLVCRYQYLSLTFRGNTFVLVPVVTKEVKSEKLVYKSLLLLLEILGSGRTNCTVLWELPSQLHLIHNCSYKHHSALPSGNSCMDKCCVPQNFSTKMILSGNSKHTVKGLYTGSGQVLPKQKSTREKTKCDCHVVVSPQKQLTKTLLCNALKRPYKIQVLLTCTCHFLIRWASQALCFVWQRFGRGRVGMVSDWGSIFCELVQCIRVHQRLFGVGGDVHGICGTNARTSTVVMSGRRCRQIRF
jgi:hypothetical protein